MPVLPVRNSHVNWMHVTPSSIDEKGYTFIHLSMYPFVLYYSAELPSVIFMP